MKSLNLFHGVPKRKAQQKLAIVEDDSDHEDPKIYENPKAIYWRQFLTADQFGVVFGANENQREPYFDYRMIREFAEQLGGDSLECCKHIYDVRYLWSEKVKEHYKKIYAQCNTIPIVFLSVVKTDEKKIKAIYLWQFNQHCPISQQKMEIDCSTKKKIFVPHNSILLLAKFVTSGNEELLEGQFLSDSRILVKSRLSGSHLRFREYDMMDLRELVKINPYETQVKNAFYCASKLDISLDEVSGINCELSRIRRLGEIELLEYYQKESGVESLPMFIKTDSQKIETKSGYELSNSLFSEAHPTRITGETVLIDRDLAKMILFKKDSLKIIDLSVIGQISSIYKNNDDVFYFLNKEGKVFRIVLSDENLQMVCEDLVQISVRPEEDGKNVKFLRANDLDFLVYLDGTKFYSLELQKEAAPKYLFDVEEIESGEKGEHQQQQFNRKLIWEVVQDNLVFIRGISIHLYDVTENKFERKGLERIEMLEYWDKNFEWQFLSKKNRLFVLSRVGNFVKIMTFTLKEKVSQNRIDSWCGNLKPTEDSLFVQVTGPNDNILFLRFEEPYLKDDVHQVNDTPNYLFSSFVFPPRGKPLMAWEKRERERKLKREQEKREEHEKKVEGEMKELEELGEMKMRVNQHLKDGRGGGGKNQEKHQEERREKMKDLRKAIVRTDQEEGADRLDKRLKDVKEGYMAMYQDLKKEKKHQIKEKEKEQNKDRKIERNNKKGEYE